MNYYHSFFQELGFSEVEAEKYIQRFSQLAEEIKQLKQMKSDKTPPLMLGINGCQGSGKSTLSAFLQRCLSQQHSLSSVVMSIDDFYYSEQQRIQLANAVHPLLKTRGVPGTHDIKQLAATITQLRSAQPHLTIPRFDKSTDNPYPRSEWQQLVHPVDIVILEGWCCGITPQTAEQLVKPINLLEQQRDVDCKWRNYVNQQLTAYQSVFAQFDAWVMLKAPSFEAVFDWRLQQEQQLAKSLKAKAKSVQGLLNEQQIADFIQHFQRITQHALDTFESKADWVYVLDKNRKVVNCSLM